MERKEGGRDERECGSEGWEYELITDFSWEDLTVYLLVLQPKI